MRCRRMAEKVNGKEEDIMDEMVKAKGSVKQTKQEDEQWWKANDREATCRRDAPLGSSAPPGPPLRQ